MAASAASAAASTKAVNVQGKAGTTVYNVPTSWESVKALGSGAYAAVAAFRGPDGAEFAVKKVERVFDHPVLALRTLREVRLLAHFRHPNVLSIQDLFLEAPDFKDAYLCLEIMDGDLNQLIYSGKAPLSDYQVQCVLYQLLRGLLCLLRAHVLHRDLKPGNILVRAGGEVKIADLGLARTVDAEDDGQDEAVLTEYVVTRYYRAPEVVLTATQYTYAVDMWSSGCVLGEMITRRPLFEGKDPLDQIRKIITVLGSQSADEMGWIPRSSHSWKFVERCNQTADGEVFKKILAHPKANPLATDLLVQMLRFNPSRRISVEDCLRHKYVEVFQPEGDPEVVSAREVKPVDWSFDRELMFHADGRPRPYDARAFNAAFFKAQRMVAALDGGLEGQGDGTSPTTSPSASSGADALGTDGAAPGHDQQPPKRWGRRWRDTGAPGEGPPS